MPPDKAHADEQLCNGCLGLTLEIAASHSKLWRNVGFRREQTDPIFV